MIATSERMCQRETKVFANFFDTFYIQIYGSLGEITCDANSIYLYDFSSGIRSQLKFEYPPKTQVQGHQGADFFLLDNFINAVALKNESLITSDAFRTLQSHLICFAAEKSRIEGTVINFGDFINLN